MELINNVLAMLLYTAHFSISLNVKCKETVGFTVTQHEAKSSFLAVLPQIQLLFFFFFLSCCCKVTAHLLRCSPAHLFVSFIHFQRLSILKGMVLITSFNLWGKASLGQSESSLLDWSTAETQGQFSGALSLTCLWLGNQ